MPVQKTRKCPKCHGRGWLRRCPECHGEGEIEVPMITALPNLQADLAEAMQQDAAADATLLALQKENSDLKQQIADMQKPKVVKILNIQSVAPETLWYEARSPGSPKTGPHGTITIVPGSPATADFH